MPEVNFYLIRQKTKLEGFKQNVADMSFGDKNLYERLKGQLDLLKVKYIVIDQSSYKFDKNDICFFDDCLYSTSLIQKIISSAQDYTNTTITVETTFNSSINYASQMKSQLQMISNGEKKAFIEQSKLFYFNLNLPEKVYPESDYQAVAPSLYFQSIKIWPDLLKAQSLVARDLTIQTIIFWKRFLNPCLMNKLFNNQRLASTVNQIGKNCKIHPTAILESCVVGDNVEIGPYCYLRASHIGSSTTIREHSSIKLSTVGTGSYILPCDIFNCYIGRSACITTSILFHTVISDATFLGGGVGFSDLNANTSNVEIQHKNQKISSEQMFLGSAVAENCFIGAGLLFHVGQLIPHDTKIVNAEMINKNNFKSHKTYVSKNGSVTQIPQNFLNNENV